MTVFVPFIVAAALVIAFTVLYFANKARGRLRNARVGRTRQRGILQCKTLTELSGYRNKFIDEKAHDPEYNKDFALKVDTNLTTNTLLGNIAYLCLHAPVPYSDQWRMLLTSIIETKKFPFEIEDL
jgi:hypothetical protein